MPVILARTQSQFKLAIRDSTPSSQLKRQRSLSLIRASTRTCNRHLTLVASMVKTYKSS